MPTHRFASWQRQARDSLDPIVHKLADEIESSEADSLSKGALLALQEELSELATQISTVHNSIASVETGKARTEARAVVRHQSTAPPFAPRLIKSAIAAVVMIAVRSFKPAEIRLSRLAPTRRGPSEANHFWAFSTVVCSRASNHVEFRRTSSIRDVPHKMIPKR